MDLSHDTTPPLGEPRNVILLGLDTPLKAVCGSVAARLNATAHVLDQAEQLEQIAGSLSYPTCLITRGRTAISMLRTRHAIYRGEMDWKSNANEPLEWARMIPLVVIDSDSDAEVAIDCLNLGVDVYLQQPPHEDVFTQVVDQVLQRNAVQKRMICEHRRLALVIDQLTLRQQNILADVIDGCPSNKIASKHDVSKRLIELERSRLMSAFGVRSASELLALMARKELLDQAFIGRDRLFLRFDRPQRQSARSSRYQQSPATP